MTVWQVYSVLPVIRPVPLDEVAYRVWERYQLGGWDGVDDCPLAPAVRRHLVALAKAGRVCRETVVLTDDDGATRREDRWKRGKGDCDGQQ